METASAVRSALYRGDRAEAERLAATAELDVFDAAALGDADRVRVLVRVQPLHSAAANGNLESCRLLLAAGADPHAKQQGEFTPMDEAVLTKNEGLIALLREYGA